LPLETGASLLDHWQAQSRELVGATRLTTLPVRVLLDWSTPEPMMPGVCEGVSMTAERDPEPLRGTAGVLRDVLLRDVGGVDGTEEYDDDDFIVVANAAQVLLQPLVELVGSMAETGSDVSVVSHPDGTPSGVMLLRRACLRLIPEVGFIDMKEQGLPRITSQFRGSVVYRNMTCGVPVRSLHDYIRALRWYHKRRAGVATTQGAFSEDWRSSFFIVEEGASVDPNVRLHDSVVLRGGRVESDAYVVRSMVCPKGVVSRRQTVINELVA
jgi:hypothetical protein